MTLNSSGGIAGYDDYYPFGAQMPGRSSVSSAEFRYRFTGKERDVNETGWDYFGARYYDSRIGRWLGVDPLGNKYPALSPYDYASNNPLKFVDPNGKEITTYTDNDGRVTKITNDGKTDLYSLNGQGNYELRGQTAQVLSFANQKDPYGQNGEINVGQGAKINYGSFDAKNQINNSLSTISPNLGGFVDYAMNAGSGEKYDIKSSMGMYSGSQISSGVYASARDAGNILAGAAAKKAGLDFTTAMTGFGSLQMAGNSKTLAVPIFLLLRSTPFGSSFIPNYGENEASHKMQKYGYSNWNQTNEKNK
jgi:RHS repeat-associated protein